MVIEYALDQNDFTYLTMDCAKIRILFAHPNQISSVKADNSRNLYSKKKMTDNSRNLYKEKRTVDNRKLHKEGVNIVFSHIRR